MNLPEYITKDDVKRVCKALKIRDWTQLKEARIQPGEARKVLAVVNTERMPIALDQFRAGLDVELEHGLRFPDANVTNNHPVITGKIVLAHLKESLDYYTLLEVAELEGDLAKAIAAGRAAKARDYYRRLALAKIALAEAEHAMVK